MLRSNFLGLVIGRPGMEPHPDQAREKARERKRGDKSGDFLERSCQLKPGADMETHRQVGIPRWARVPRGPFCSYSSVAPELGPTQAGSIPSSCGTTSQRNETHVSTSSSCPQAPRPGSPRHIRAIVPEVHLQLSGTHAAPA